MKSTEDIFTGIGGEFCIPFSDFAKKLQSIKAFIFDWDGVFNSGIKNDSAGSAFSEVDSMGTNLLRFGYWLKNKQLPVCSVITGETNKTAFYLSQREHFHSVYFNCKDKSVALAHLCKHTGINPSQVAYVFDDVLDISLAKICGLRLLINRKGSPLLHNFIKKNNFCDYVSANPGNEHAVREICELMLGTLEIFDQTMQERVAFEPNYANYLGQRSKVETAFYTGKSGEIIKDEGFK